MSYLFNTILYQPLFNALIAIYNTIGFSDLGLSVIILTIIIRIILFPFFHKSARNQVILQKIQPEIKALNEKHKNDKEAQVKAILKVYQDNKVNPFSSLFLIFLQLPILIALFYVFKDGITFDIINSNIYSFINYPEIIHTTLLNLINLTESSIIVIGLAAILQYIQGRLSLAKIPADSPAAKISGRMIWVAPILTFLVFYRFPAVLGLYLVTTTIFSIIQQLYINYSLSD